MATSRCRSESSAPAHLEPPRGWVEQPRTPPKDFAYAVSKRLMFKPGDLTHAQHLRRLERVHREVDLSLVGNAFLSSLSSRRLDLRGALASYFVVRHLKPHAPTGQGRCSLCELPKKARFDANVLSFERHHFGGVRFTDVDYALFDLEQLLSFDVPLPTAKDFEIFHALIAVAKAQAPKARAANLLKAITPLMVGNQNERSTVLIILATAGLLCPAKHAAHLERFELLGGGSNDFGFPLCEWRGADGVNEQALKTLLDAL